jgi:hypothetical protein
MVQWVSPRNVMTSWRLLRVCEEEMASGGLQRLRREVTSGQPTSVGPAARELVGKQQLFAVNISAPYEVFHRVRD